MKLKHIRQILFDADDTLWENNIYYVKATEDFFDLLVPHGLDRAALEREFDELELKVVRERGYGSHNFVYILETLFERYQNYINYRDFKAIVDRFNQHPHDPKLFPGVIETLQYLKTNYHLYVLTKGDFKEQEGKIINAGIDKLVNAYFIVPEKEDAVYKEILQKHNWQADQTCMVGNSPKSDINPALRVGMYAVYIPYANTWKLDFEQIQPVEGRYFKVERFSDLKNLF